MGDAVGNVRYDLAIRAYDCEQCSYRAALLFHTLRQCRSSPVQPESVEYAIRCFCRRHGNFKGHERQQEMLEGTVRFIIKVMHDTAIPAHGSDEAVVASSASSLAVPVAYPEATVFLAVWYINRFLKKYFFIPASLEIVERTFLVSFLIAAKVIHTHLQLLVNTNQCAAGSSRPVLPYDQTHWTKAAYPDAAEILRRVPLDQHVDPGLLCMMELEMLHFIDYDLSFNPLRIWDLLYME